jgi:sialidase-1
MMISPKMTVFAKRTAGFRLFFAVLAVACSAPTQAAAASDPVFRTTLRALGQDGVFTSRIPALATTPKGTLIAAFDLRHTSSVDLPGDIDVAVMRSFDQGTTWTPAKRVMDFDKNVPGTMGNGVGDPTIVVDRNGTIFISALWVRANRTVSPPVPNELASQFMMIRSTDDGATWLEPVNLTSQVQDPAWGVAVALKGPGSGVQLRDGTLVIPTYFKTYPSAGKGQSAFIWSKDHGDTWQRVPPPMSGAARTSEAQLAELEDGSLLMSIRDHGPKKLRAWARYSWTGDIAKGHWSEPWWVVPDPVCMGSLIRHPSGPLLFSNPNSQTQRIAMTVRASTDGGRTWNGGRLIDPGLSGYSCMTVLPDGRIGMLYERGEVKYNESIQYVRFPLDWVMSAGGKAESTPLARK